MDNEKQTLIGRTIGELIIVVEELGMPAFTATQIAKWLYQRHVSSIDDMTNISKANREKLKEDYGIELNGQDWEIQNRWQKDITAAGYDVIRAI